MPPERLASRWRALLRECEVEEARGAPFLAALAAAYEEPHRAYHGLGHLAHLFTELDAIPLRDPAVEWAVWYHDVVYRAGRADNEVRSAREAGAALRALGLNPLEERVAALILATRHHRAGSADAAAQLFLDADMAILGAEPAAYQAYARGVRMEHCGIRGLLFARGRRAFLREVLARPRVFATDHFHDRYERQARENVRDELERWESS